MKVETVARWYEAEGYRVRRANGSPADVARFHADLVAERDGIVEAVAVTDGPPDATRLKILATAAAEQGAVPVLVGPDDPETQGLCAAHDVRHIPHAMIGGAFLQRFAVRASDRPPSRVVRAAFPNVPDEPPGGTAGRSAARRWIVVAFIWLIALMMVGSFLLRAF